MSVPTLTNIEVLQVTDAGSTNGAVFNLVNSTGITKIANVGSTNAAGTALAFNNVAAIADLEITSTIGAVGQTVAYAAAAVAGTTDVQKVALTSATMNGALTVAGVETMAFNAVSGNNTIGTVTAAAMTKATVEGAGNLTITNALTGATTIDASAATGNVKVAADAAKNVAFTGGKGNDTINMAAGLNSADTLNGGDGTDTLRLNTQATYATSAQTNVTNFEALQIDAASTATVDLSLYGSTNVFKTVTLGTSGSESLGLVAGQTVTITKGVTGSAINVDLNAATTGAISFALASDGTADALTLNLRGTDTNSSSVVDETIGTFTAATVEDLTITANKAVVAGTTFEDDVLGVATLSAAAATKLTITGDSAIKLGGTGSTLTALATVDAGTMTKNVTLGNGTTTVFNTANTGAAITTGSGDDSVSLDVGAAGVLKAVALGGNSTVTSTTGDTLFLKSAAGTNLTIIDLSSTTDQISQLLGSANAAVQTGIEHINLAGFAQGTAGSQITGSAEINVIVGGAGVDTINAGAGNDVITGGLGADVLTGGAGVDTFAFSTDGSVAGTSLDKISDFNTGGSDILTFGGNTTVLAAEANGTTATSDVDTSAGGLITFAAADNNYAKKVTAIQADAELDASGSIAIFVDSGNTYVYYAGAATGDADDQIIELTGVTTLTTITGGATTTIA